MSSASLAEQFKSISGCTDNNEVEQYLEACGHDLATAVDLYFTRDTTGANNVNIKIGASSGKSNGNQQSSSKDDVVMLSDDDEDVQCMQSTSSSAAVGQRVRGRGGGSSGNRVPAGEPISNNDDDVRAPIPSTRGPLVYQSFTQQYGSRQRVAHNAFNQETRNFRLEAIEQERNLRRAQNGMARLSAEHEVAQSAEISKPPNSLQSLFRPPLDIMYHGNWEAAKTIACGAEKWLLVNVQDVTEFACQTLNRDVWANSGVKELVKSNFLFWQVHHDSADGERLRNYYRILSFPSIFIVDPRTGELVTTITLNRQDPVTFCDSLATFLDQTPDLTARDRQLTGCPAPRVEADDFGPGAMPDAAAQPECSRSVSIAQAMEEECSSSRDYAMERSARKRKRELNGGSDNTVKKNRTGLDMPNLEEMLNKDTRCLSVVDREEWRKQISPHGDMCRIRLKLPDGRVHTIEITDQSPLKALVLYIAGLGVSGHDHVFVLSFPRREFSIDSSDRTLRQLGFSRNEMVHVELK